MSEGAGRGKSLEGKTVGGKAMLVSAAEPTALSGDKSFGEGGNRAGVR